jgi:hypothetical protein
MDGAPMPNHEAQLDKEALIGVGTVPVCIDDRFAVDMSGQAQAEHFVSVEEAEKGPKFLGGSAVAIPMLVDTAQEGTDLVAEKLIGYVFAASEKAGLKVGVHMHNDHGEKSMEEVAQIIEKIIGGQIETAMPGCGFWGMVMSVDNPLGLSSKSHEFFGINPYMLQMLVHKGALVSVLDGHHAPKDTGGAWATRNTIAGKTLSRRKVVEQGRVAPYAHDDEPFDRLMHALADVLVEVGEEAWAKALREQYAARNTKWLNTATMALVGSVHKVIG